MEYVKINNIYCPGTVRKTVLFLTDAVEPVPFLNNKIDVPGFQIFEAVPGNITKLYVTDPFVNENFTGKSDAGPGTSETVSPCDMNNWTAEAFVIVTGVAWVAMYAVFWSGTAQPRKIAPMMPARAMTNMIARIALMISETPLSLFFLKS